MSQAGGIGSSLVMDFETTYGADPTSKAGVKLPRTKVALTRGRNLSDSATLREERNPAEPIRGFVNVEGSLEVPLDVKAFGYWLKAAFGAPTTTGKGPYTHVFKVRAEQPSMVIEQGHADIGKYFKFNGCKVSSLSFSFGKGDGELTAKVGVIGSNGAVLSAPYKSGAQKASFLRLNNCQALLKEGGTVLADGTGGEVSLDMGLETDSYVLAGGGVRGNPREGILKASGSLTALFTPGAAALLDKGIAGTETSVEVIFTQGTHSLSFRFPEVLMEETTPGVDGPAGILLEVPWRGFHEDDANGSVVVATLVNDIAGY